MICKCPKLLANNGISLCLWLMFGLADAAARCEPQNAVARIVSVQGMIQLNDAPAALDALICPGDTLLTGPRSRGAVRLLNTETVLRIDQLSQLRILDPPRENHSLMDLIKGAIYFFSREPRSLDIQTPYLNAAVEGAPNF